MPRKTKKQKLLAQNHHKQIPGKESPAFKIVEKTPEVREVKQLPLVSHTPAPAKLKADTVADVEAAHYFRHDMRKTAVLTGFIIIVEIILYKIMSTGILEKWLPALKM